MLPASVKYARKCDSCGAEFVHVNPLVRCCDECWRKSFADFGQSEPCDLDCCAMRTVCPLAGEPGHHDCGLRVCGHPKHHVCEHALAAYQASNASAPSANRLIERKRRELLQRTLTDAADDLLLWWRSERAGNGEHAGLHPTTVARLMRTVADEIAKEWK